MTPTTIRAALVAALAQQAAGWSPVAYPRPVSLADLDEMTAALTQALRGRQGR